MAQPAGTGCPRALDVVLASMGLAIAGPFLLFAAIAIKLDSRGPAIYRQPRAGGDGEMFDLFKLRTMTLGADPVGVGTPVLEGDPRVTRVGALLRRISLDEVPNLVNVLRGEMAIVGPRPTLAAQVELLHAASAPAARGQAGAHRMGAGERSRGDPVGGADRARRLVRGPPLPGLDLRILARTARLLVTGHGLYG